MLNEPPTHEMRGLANPGPDEDPELRPARMVEIAEDLAQRHAHQVHPTHSEASASAVSFLRALETSFAEGKKQLLEVLSADEFDELSRRLCNFPRTFADRFEARLERGRFLPRPRDAFSLNVGVGVLDCEAHPDTLDIDVAWDLAAITTELNALQRVDLSETLLSAYARRSDDFDLYAVIDFYEGLHALDRALQLLDAAAALGFGERAQSLRRDARRRLLISLSTERLRLVPPQVIAMSGRVASGKSTLGRYLGDVISAPVVVADLVRVSILQAPIEDELPEAAWKQRGGGEDLYEAVYRELLRRSEIVLASGRPVVIDACFPTRKMRQCARDLARRYDAPFLFVDCQAPPELVRARLLERAVRDSLEPSVWLDIARGFDATFEEPSELSDHERIVVDTSLSLVENAALLNPRLVTGHQIPRPRYDANAKDFP
jgi:predicted kinase